MEKNVLVVSAIVGFLGIASAALAFAGEGTRIKLSDVKLAVDGCVYPESASVGLGLVSALLLLIAQIIINVVTGCYCCTTRQNSSRNNRTTGLITFIISWVTFVVAFFTLLGAAALNDQHNHPNSYNYIDGECYVLKPGVFAGAAVLVLATVALGITCYISLFPSKTWGHQNQGIAMGQPQFPGQGGEPGVRTSQQDQGSAMSNAPPVFVHEDTYRRQQYP